MPHTGKLTSAASGPKFTILWGRLEDILLLNKFLPIVDSALVAKIWPEKVVRWCAGGDVLAIFLRPAFPASPVQHVSDLHPKFA